MRHPTGSRSAPFCRSGLHLIGVRFLHDPDPESREDSPSSGGPMRATRNLRRAAFAAALLLIARTSLAQTPVQITEFPVGGTAVPITVGSDGNLWMTFNGADVVGRMTPGGALSPFHNGVAFTAIVFGHCVDGHDGGVWCSNGGGAIVRTDVATGASTIFNGFPAGSGANDL